MSSVLVTNGRAEWSVEGALRHDQHDVMDRQQLEMYTKKRELQVIRTDCGIESSERRSSGAEILKT